MSDRIYQHDFDSVGHPLADLFAPPAMKSTVLSSYSTELSDDGGHLIPEALRDLLGMGRPMTWAERAEALREESSLRRRVARRWRAIRVRFAHWAADEFVGADGWDA